MNLPNQPGYYWAKWKQKYTACRPGWVYVPRADYEAGKSPLRIEGLSNPEEGEYAPYIRR